MSILGGLFGGRFGLGLLSRNVTVAGTHAIECDRFAAASGCLWPRAEIKFHSLPSVARLSVQTETGRRLVAAVGHAILATRISRHAVHDAVFVPIDAREQLGIAVKMTRSVGADGVASPEEFQTIQVQMFEYAQELGRRKRSEPQDDVWTILSTVEVETDDGERTTLGVNTPAASAASWNCAVARAG